MSILFLIGYRACGKTTIAKALNRKTTWHLIDTDALIVEQAGCDIATIIKRHGWEYFRDREAKALALCAQEKQCIVSTGGGIILRPENRAILRETGTTIFLNLPSHAIVKRLMANPIHSQRPSLTNTSLTDEVEAVLNERLPLYKEVADITLDARRPVKELVADLMPLCP